MSNGRSQRSSPAFHFAAGLGSGLCSAVLLQPADLLKTRVQQSGSSTVIHTLQQIFRAPNPVRQLWRGTVPSALRTGFGSALYFSTLNTLRQYAAHRGLLSNNLVRIDGIPAGSSTLPKLSNAANLATGAIARTSVGFVMMPITVIKVRFESSYYNYRSLWAAASDIVGKQGIGGFFAGFGATALRDAPYAGLYVAFYEQSKRRLGLLAHKADSLLESGHQNQLEHMTTVKSASVNFVSGLVAAGLATCITNPFDAIKTRIQLQPEKYGNMIQAARLMVRIDGVRSLFDGLGLRMARKALSSALAWTLYEEIIRKVEINMVA